MNIGGAWEDTRRRLLRRILQSPHTQPLKNLSSGRSDKFSMKVFQQINLWRMLLAYFYEQACFFWIPTKILSSFHSYSQAEKFKERKFFNYGRVFPAWSIHTESGRGGSQCQVSSRHSISHHLALNLHLWACWAQYKRCAWISDKILEFKEEIRRGKKLRFVFSYIARRSIYDDDGGHRGVDGQGLWTMGWRHQS